MIPPLFAPRASWPTLRVLLDSVDTFNDHPVRLRVYLDYLASDPGPCP